MKPLPLMSNKNHRRVARAVTRYLAAYTDNVAIQYYDRYARLYLEKLIVRISSQQRHVNTPTV